MQSHRLLSMCDKVTINHIAMFCYCRNLEINPFLCASPAKVYSRLRIFKMFKIQATRL